MAKFEVREYVVSKLENHPNADRLVIYHLEDTNLRVVANKETAVAKGESVLYFPEHAIIPEWILKDFGFWNEEKSVGYLSGKEGRIVKPIKLRGVQSDGLAIPFEKIWNSEHVQKYLESIKNYTQEDIFIEMGMDENAGREPRHSWAGILKVTKYVPEVKDKNNTEHTGLKVKFDVENIHKYNKLLSVGEEIVVTEKIHGSCAIYHLEADPTTNEFNFRMGSKGQAAQGIWFKEDSRNWYSRANDKYSIEWNMKKLINQYPYASSITVIGEVYGPGVQKGWAYGIDSGDIGFKAFELLINGEPTDDYQNKTLVALSESSIPIVNVLSDNQYIDSNRLETLANDDSFYEGVKCREGIVVRPRKTRVNPETGETLILKFISEKYKDKAPEPELDIN